MNPFDRLSNRWTARIAITVTSLLGCILIASAYFDGGRQGAWFLLVAPTGLIFLAVSWFTYRRFLGSPEPLHLQVVDGGIEVPIWRRQLVDLLAAILAVVVAVVWGLVTALVVGATWWPWALALGLVAVLAAQFIRSIRRRPALTLRTDGVTYRGPTVDSFSRGTTSPASSCSRAREGRYW